MCIRDSIGLNCYQTFQPEVYDIVKMKELYGKDLAFWGGISTQQVLPRVSPEEVKKETVRIIRTLRQGGGLIAAPTHALAFDVPPENILAMVEVFQHQQDYICLLYTSVVLQVAFAGGFGIGEELLVGGRVAVVAGGATFKAFLRRWVSDVNIVVDPVIAAVNHCCSGNFC